jgi:hypothetical protein
VKKIKEMTIVSPVEDGLQIQPRLLASQPRIQDILSNTRELYYIRHPAEKWFRMKSQN